MKIEKEKQFSTVFHLLKKKKNLTHFFFSVFKTSNKETRSRKCFFIFTPKKRVISFLKYLKNIFIFFLCSVFTLKRHLIGQGVLVFTVSKHHEGVLQI